MIVNERHDNMSNGIERIYFFKINYVSCNLHLIMSIKNNVLFFSIFKKISIIIILFFKISSFLYSKEIARVTRIILFMLRVRKLGLHGNKTKKGGGKL